MKQSRYNVWVDRDNRRFVYNGMSGQLLDMSRDQAGAVQRLAAHGDSTGLDPEQAEKLVRDRFLVADSVDELEVLESRYKLARYDSTHLGFTFITSLGCNFDCPYCYESKSPSIMSDEVRRAVLALVDDTIESLHGHDTTLNTMHVTWMGGEPLIGRAALFALSYQLMERCDQEEATYGAGLVTNGWYLSEDVCRELQSHRLSFVQITLDGPPDVHDAMRPLASGGSTFGRIVENLHHAADLLDSVVVRVNIDESNFHRSVELLDHLEQEGFAGRIGIAPAKMTSYDDNDAAPLSTYGGRCYSSTEYAKVELEFLAMARERGLSGPSLPEPTSSPCTAVQANELVVGSYGELYKCWDEVGNHEAAIGDIRSYLDIDSRMHKWLQYSPFEDDQCRDCIALPVCMGGCAHHEFAGHAPDDKCGTFRYTYREQIGAYIDSLDAGPQIGLGSGQTYEMLESSRAATATAAPMDSTPVTLRLPSGATA